MRKVNINSSYKKNYTSIPNFFIDHYLAEANGDFVKVYIWLIKQVDHGYDLISLENIADTFNLTEADVLRAIKYWHKMQVIDIEWDNGDLDSISILDHQNESHYEDPVQEQETQTIKPEVTETEIIKVNAYATKPYYTTNELVSFKEQEGFEQLIFVAESYIGKVLNESDLRVIVSLHDWLNLPFDVIEKLIEYCATNNHRNLRYIEKVAIDWAENQINTLEKAILRTETYNKQYFMIFKALGLGTRNPVQFEIKLMDEWIKQFDLDIILEACDRTIKRTNSPSLKYTDSILKDWGEKNVRIFSDIQALDAAFNNEKEAKNKKQESNNKNNGKKRFINYEQRDYDFDAIEAKAMKMRLEQTEEED